jgi:hypothetical protein
MASADFCSITQSVSAPVRCPIVGRVLWLPCRFQQDLSQTPIDIKPPFEQISPDKNVNCPAQLHHLLRPLNQRALLYCANLL